MPNTQDNTHLRREVVQLIETIWRESLAARHVAKYYCKDENPKTLLGEARRMPKLNTKISEQFGEILNTLQSAPSETSFLSALIESLRRCVDDYSQL